MKKYYNNWKNMDLVGKILSLPGLLLISIVMVALSPIFLVCLSASYTMDVLGVENDFHDDAP
jgi:hypothetical protein